MRPASDRTARTARADADNDGDEGAEGDEGADGDASRDAGSAPALVEAAEEKGSSGRWVKSPSIRLLKRTFPHLCAPVLQPLAVCKSSARVFRCRVPRVLRGTIGSA